MQTIQVRLGERSYPVVIGNGILRQLPRALRAAGLAGSAYVITNPTIQRLHGKKLRAALDKAAIETRTRLIPDRERSKSLQTAGRLLRDLARFGVKRRVYIIAFGGGVVGDLAGFAASVYRRGIPYLQVPTTLLAQIDSAIGGKTAVDLPEGKNLVGSFYQPRLVASDTSLLATLSARDMQSGLAEMIKYAFIKDPGLCAYLEQHLEGLKAFSPQHLDHCIRRCSRIKAEIVEKDEREEKGLRTILNFGHTIGHALEAATGYTRYTHGEAIGLGMRAAGLIGVGLGVTPPQAVLRLTRLLEAAGLPTRIKGVPGAKILRCHYADKKFSGLTNRFVLLQALGKPVVKENIPPALIKEAMCLLTSTL